MTDPLSPDDQPTLLAQTESAIGAARNYIQPSDDLRPRTIEAAREYCDDRRAERKLGGLAIAVLLMMTFSSPTIQYVDVLRSQASAPSATEMQYRAIEYGAHREIGANWGLTEAFTQLRRVQASRLGQSYRSFK